MKVLVAAVRPPLLALPEVGLDPDQASEALQEVALVDDHVSMAALPLVTDVGSALRDTVGAGVDDAFTITTTDLLALPPIPLQFRLNVLVAVSVPVDSLPVVDLLPDQAPEAVQEVALVDDHDRVLEAALATDVGLALSDMVGSVVIGVLPSLEILSVPTTPLLQALRNNIQTEMQTRRIRAQERFNSLSIIGNDLFHAKSF